MFDVEVAAYSVPLGVVGEHIFSGPVGMDFRADHHVIITHLGAFDSAADGLWRNISVSLWGTESRDCVARVTFTPHTPGHLVGSTRFLPIAPLLLPKVRSSVRKRGAVLVRDADPRMPRLCERLLTNL